MGRAVFAANGFEVVAPDPLPVAQMIVGRSVDHAIEVLPRLFNLCQSAQSVAIRLACGRQIGASDIDRLRADIAQEHKLRLGVLLPLRLGLPTDAVPQITPDLSLDEACKHSAVLAAVRDSFAPFEACAPAQTAETLVAARQAHAPIMQEAEKRFGRGPLWRVLARFCDLCTLALPAPRRVGGWAEVPAARGAYRVRAAVFEGKITAFDRRTPTDEMLQTGGVLAQSLSRVTSPERAQLVIDILDPCVPLELRQVSHA